jgi:hypothetical protein
MAHQTHHKPKVEQWYKMPDGECFRVTEFDRQDEIVEIQYLDGAIESLELATWNKLNAIALKTPPLDLLEDLGHADDHIDFDMLEVAPGTESPDFGDDMLGYSKN